MGAHRWLAIIAGAALTAGGVAGCSPGTRPGELVSRSHPASVITAPPASRAPSPPAGTPSPGPAAAPACRTGHLAIQRIYGGAAAGTISAVIGFTNQGSRPCTLAGWPALVAIGPAERGAARRTLGVFGGPMLTVPPVVTIRPGARAVAVVTGSDNPGPGMTTCPPPYRRLRVTPPGGSRSTLIPAWIPLAATGLPACSGISISPVIATQALPYLPPAAAR